MNYFVRRQENEYGGCDGMIHEIKEGDSLYKVARLYGISLEDLMEKNPTVDVYNLRIGDKLCIPMKYKTYQIKQGDTLDELLERFLIDYESFRGVNPQMKSIKLPEGEVVFLPETSRW